MFSTINKDFKTENPWSQKRLLLSNKYPENYRVKLFNVFIFTALYSILDYNLKIQSQLIMFRINKSDKNQSYETISSTEQMKVSNMVYISKGSNIKKKLYSFVYQGSYFELFPTFTEWLLHFYIKKEQVCIM